MLKGGAGKKCKTKIIAYILGAIILIDLTPLGGNTTFYSKWVQCGSRPVYTQMGAGIASPGVPNYVTAPGLGVMRGFMPYFCSPYDAEKAGYSANESAYSFPHLPASEFQESIKKSRAL